MNQFIRDAGGELLAVYTQDPPVINEIFELAPDIILFSEAGPLHINWSFLLRLKSFRLQGKQWPKIILADPYPSPGIYLVEQDEYSEENSDYYFLELPYRNVSSIVSCTIYHYKILGTTLKYV
jgi:hypothetical protein